MLPVNHEGPEFHGVMVGLYPVALFCYIICYPDIIAPLFVVYGTRVVVVFGIGIDNLVFYGKLLYGIPIPYLFVDTS